MGSSSETVSCGRGGEKSASGNVEKEAGNWFSAEQKTSYSVGRPLTVCFCCFEASGR